MRTNLMRLVAGTILATLFLPARRCFIYIRPIGKKLPIVKKLNSHKLIISP